MDTEQEVVAYLLRTFDELSIPYMIGGSWALIVWAGPRYTHDIDVVVDLPLDRIAPFCARFPADQFYIDPQAMRAQFRQPDSPSAGMYSFYHPGTGLKIDLFPLRLHDPVQRAAFARGVRVPLLDIQSAIVSSAQDLLIQKLRWWELGGRQSTLQFRDCVKLLLADRLQPAPQIDWARVDQITAQLGPRIQDAWHLVGDAVEQAQQSTEVPGADPPPDTTGQA